MAARVPPYPQPRFARPLGPPVTGQAQAPQGLGQPGVPTRDQPQLPQGGWPPQAIPGGTDNLPRLGGPLYGGYPPAVLPNAAGAPQPYPGHLPPIPQGLGMARAGPLPGAMPQPPAGLPPHPGQPVIPLPMIQGLVHTRPHTFSQVYADESKDPCTRDYTRIMQRFDASALNAVTGPTLFNQVTRVGASQLQAYLCCGSGVGNNQARIYCVHAPAKFITALDSSTTTWDDWCFAFLGKLVQGQVTNVLLPNSIFEPTLVWTLPQHMLAHLEDLSEAEPFFPPIAANDNQAEEIETRPLMYLPAIYIPLLLSSGGCSPRQVWECLYPAIQQQQELVICRP